MIGLDLGTKCGWAVMLGKRRLASGRWNLQPRSKEPRGVRWQRFTTELRHHLVSLEELHPDRDIIVVYERVRRHVGVTAAHVYGGFLAQLELTAMHHNFTSVEFVPIEIGTWKKAATGRGNATKDFVIKKMHQRFKVRPTTEDEADALGVAEAYRILREAGEL